MDPVPQTPIAFILQILDFGCLMIRECEKLILRYQQGLPSYMIDPEVFAHTEQPKLKRGDLAGQGNVGLHKSICHQILCQFCITAQRGGVQKGSAVVPLV